MKREFGSKFLFVSVLAALSLWATPTTTLGNLEKRPTIQADLFGDQLVLSFTGDLEESADCIHWTPVKATSTYLVELSDVKKFFRASNYEFSRISMAMIGGIPGDDCEVLDREGIDLFQYNEAELLKYRNVILSDMESATGEQMTAIKEMFDESGEVSVSLYEPTDKEITVLRELLLGETTSAIDQEDSLESNDDGKDEQIRIYTISRDDLGNMYTYTGIQQGLNSKYQLVGNDAIRKEDVDAGFVWVMYNKENSANEPYDVITYELEEIQDTDGNYFEITKKDVIGKVSESAITIDEDGAVMTVEFDGSVHNALFVQKEKKSYSLGRRGVELPDDMETSIKVMDIPLTDEEKKAAGEMTDSEKVMQAKETDMKGFCKWLLYDRDKILSDSSAASENDDPKMPDIFDIACKTSDSAGTSFANLPGLTISVTSVIASVHHFEGDATNGGNDLYYVKQHCVLNNGASSAYKRHWYQHSYYEPIKLLQVFENKNDWFWIGGAECDEFYIAGYDIAAELEGNLTYPNVNCIKAKPEAYNKVTNITVSHETSVGASGHAGTANDHKDIGVALNFGYKSNKSESYQTSDIENTLNNTHKRISWRYESTKIPHRASPWWKLSYPAALTVSCFQPEQCYIWQIPTSQRSAYSTLKSSVAVDVWGSYSRNSGSIPDRQLKGRVAAAKSIKLPKPPLFCLDKATVNFDERTAKTDYVVVYSQGSWNWDKSTVPNWLTLTYTPSNCQITIEAQPNTTGSTRTAEIKLQRGDGSQPWDKRTITVTQSRYSK